MDKGYRGHDYEGSARALLPGMLKRGSGAIINVVSMSAFQPVPYLAVYGASKAFMLSLTEGLAVELRGSGVLVQAVCPGLVQTEFQERAGTDQVLFNKLPVTSPESVARASLDALAHGMTNMVAFSRGGNRQRLLTVE